MGFERSPCHLWTCQHSAVHIHLYIGGMTTLQGATCSSVVAKPLTSSSLDDLTSSIFITCRCYCQPEGYQLQSVISPGSWCLRDTEECRQDYGWSLRPWTHFLRRSSSSRRMQFTETKASHYKSGFSPSTADIISKARPCHWHQTLTPSFSGSCKPVYVNQQMKMEAYCLDFFFF